LVKYQIARIVTHDLFSILSYKYQKTFNIIISFPVRTVSIVCWFSM
jgi:hypothetical protein